MRETERDGSLLARCYCIRHGVAKGVTQAETRSRAGESPRLSISWLTRRPATVRRARLPDPYM